MEVTLQTAEELGLTREEYQWIQEFLGRTPNYTELSMYSVMWSEHCSYKNSIFWLKKLPKKGKHLLAEAGEENAGLIDLGNGLGCAFKIESHNHPSAVEPYQGAATGVGGINRDIFTMGARPIAQLNSLRFGDIKKDKTQWLIKGVVKGIGDYGNAFGVPVVGGEVYFDECYNTNPLVNAMSVGIVKTNRMVSAISKGKGNPVFIVGSATGKDGIHGATFASEDISEDSADKIPSVQVGDPFQEKLLLEATLEVIKTDAIIGMQDMGAAGITCSTSEMSAKGKHGMKIHLDKVPLRQKDMQPFEILLSESQERMLVVVKKGREQEVIDVYNKWDLHCVEIGEVSESEDIVFYMNHKEVAKVPADSLVLGGGAPVYQREYKEPEYINKTKRFLITDIPEPKNLREIALFLTAHPNIASKRWVTEQYDTMVGTINMTTNKPSDAAIVNLKETDKALAMTVDCNARYVFADPQKGTEIAIAEAARNIICSGGTPSAITNCLNFGNPYNKEVYWQFVNTIKGMINACSKFNTPVTGGNVSFYNQSTIVSKTVPIHPTPVIGMIGIVENKNNVTGLGFQQTDDIICLIGAIRNDIASSQYLYSYHNEKYSPAPEFNLDEEFQMHTALMNAIQTGKIKSAHDVSDGGLFIALLESGFVNGFGFDIDNPEKKIRKDAFLFGESQGRVVISCSKKDFESIAQIFKNYNVPFNKIGQITDSEILVSKHSYGFISDYKNIYQKSIESYLD